VPALDSRQCHVAVGWHIRDGIAPACSQRRVRSMLQHDLVAASTTAATAQWRPRGGLVE